MIETYRKTNEYNTPLDDQYYLGLNKDIQEEINAAIDEVIFIQRLIDPDMPTLGALQRDEMGRVVVDITSPHRLVNMVYFTQSADHFRKHGCYTLYPVNHHPKSPYYLYWQEEKRRIKDGFIREDGEWIPGSLYWYWNFNPILKTRRIGVGKRSERIHDFGDRWLGDYLFFHYMEQAMNAGMHIEVMKCRGVGNSFKMGSIGPRNALFKPRSKTFYMASDMQYLTKDGVLTKAWDNLDFLSQNTPFPRLRIKDTQLEKRIGYKDVRTGSEKGMKSDIIGLSTKDDPQKGRGKRGDIMFEEYGSYPHIKSAWAIARASVEDGDNVFGLLCAAGTGGEIGSDFEGAEDMFYYPDSYNIMSLPNVYDRNTNGGGTCGFFWGSYLSRSNCYDENGMPDVTKALKELFIEVDRIRKSASDPMALTQRKAEMPVTPQDSMMRVDGTIFPVADIREYLERIMPSIEEFVGPHYIGDLVFDLNGKAQWRVNGFVKPIREFPLKDNKHEGAIEIFERPFLVNDEPQRGRYVAGIDPFDDDSSNTVSLGSIFILDLFTDRIVAEYTGRPKFANDFFEICRRMLMYYNAVGNYENDKKGLFQYFDRKNCLYLLSDTLQSLKDVEMVRGNLYGNKAKGCNSGRFINARGRRLLADYMMTDAFGENQEGRTILNLHKIRSIGLLLEAMKYNVNGNFDRISACGMLMLIREDRQKFIDNIMNSENKPFTGLQFDPYFLRNSKGHLTIPNEKIFN
jgi:hypothetical protein